jgi:hypothetical protein
MVKKGFIVSLLVTISCFSFAQQSYYDYRVSQNVYYESFEDNRNDWDISDNTEIRQEISEGKYLFESKTNESKATWTTVDFDYTQDFEIETVISYKSGTQDNSYGLIWGKSSENNDMYTYFFSATGYYRIDKLIDGVFHTYTDWINSELVNNFEFNKLTVRKIGPTVYYYLNETYIFEHMAPKLFGNNFGFHVTNGAAILIDYLSVSYLTKN